MIAAARAKISEVDAKRLILERFQRLLTEQFDGYLRQYERAFISAVENLWHKYAVNMSRFSLIGTGKQLNSTWFLEGVEL